MASVKENTTMDEFQDFVKEVYGLSNDRHFNTWDMLANIERFIMRGLKGIRKKDHEKTKINLMVSLSWFMSLMNQLHISVGDEIWKRFPYACSYCGFCPCSCKEKKIKKRKKFITNSKNRPGTLKNFQEMFEKIYPSKGRNLKDAGIHLAEEMGELLEAISIYRGNHNKKDFNRIRTEAADLFSCMAGVFNSLGMDMAKELSFTFSNNCHACEKSPCICSFSHIVKFKS